MLAQSLRLFSAPGGGDVGTPSSQRLWQLPPAGGQIAWQPPVHENHFGLPLMQTV